MSGTLPTVTGTATAPTLPASLKLGAAHLVVRDLDRSIAFYETAIGLSLRERSGETASLHAGAEDLLVLHERPDARPAGRESGLYHVALLHPSRRELARAAVRLAATRTPIDGASDHGISEAIYLPDPDGNGLELAADRPRQEWRLELVSNPLDLDSLLAEVADEGVVERADPGLAVGHLHLHVSDLDAALAFYVGLIGFTEMMQMPSAAFVSAGGYHHHLGLNIWRGRGIPAQPADVVGLDHWRILLPTAEDVAEVRGRLAVAGYDVAEAGTGFRVVDPFGIPLVLTSR
jgi:catechol 2,3-dioxygenase